MGKIEKRSMYLTAAVCFFFLFFATGFVFLMIHRNREKNIHYFMELAQQKKETIERHVQSKWENLNGVAVCIGNMADTDADKLIPLLREIIKRNSFTRMGFIQPDGTGDLVDIDGGIHLNVDFGEAVFFQEALDSRYSISQMKEDVYSRRMFNYYGVPVVSEGEVIGVLCAQDRAELLNSFLSSPAFRGKSAYYIVNLDGTYMAESKAGRNAGDSTQIEAFLAKMREHFGTDGAETGFTEFHIGKQKVWGVYMPLAVNQWCLAGLVPPSAVNNDYYSVLGVVAIISAAVFIFMLLMYYMNRAAVENRLKLDQLVYMDPLLNLPNYTKFKMEAEDLLKQEKGRRMAFWYADIDDFKIFNESFSYSAGDRLLQEFSQQLKKLSEKEELFCRINADCFVGIRFYETREELPLWYGELADRLGAYELPDGRMFRLVLSMGFYCIGDSPGLTLNEIFNRATIAQKSIKRQRHVKYAFYADHMRRQILIEYETETKMQHALDQGQFEVYIQPKVDIQNGNRIVAGEALVRWIDPQKGMISPGVFIPLFEKNGFIIRLDRYMLERVCIWLEENRAKGRRLVKIAINVSRIGIFQEDFLEYYTRVKETYSIPDGMLELEFTESMALENTALLRERILALRQNGFICSLDDFGSGYSSLNVLKNLPIQILKLDILFFRKGADEHTERIIVSNIVHMAKQLKMKTVSEGVESWEQVEFLRETGCDIVQGYIFAKPVPAVEFEKLLLENPKGRWSWDRGLHARTAEAGETGRPVQG